MACGMMPIWIHMEKFSLSLALCSGSGCREKWIFRMYYFICAIWHFFPSTLTDFSHLLAGWHGWVVMTMVILVFWFPTKRIVVMIIIAKAEIIDTKLLFEVNSRDLWVEFPKHSFDDRNWRKVKTPFSRNNVKQLWETFSTLHQPPSTRGWRVNDKRWWFYFN